LIDPSAGEGTSAKDIATTINVERIKLEEAVTLRAFTGEYLFLL
jgi:hypothetical protein